MNNKNKGFSLVELLAVLVVLVVIALIAITSIRNILDETDDVISDDTEKQILNAAEKWAIENSDKFDDTEAKKMQVGLDVVFVLDMSGSMETKDIISSDGKKVTRNQAMVEATNAAMTELGATNNSRMGLVLFGNSGDIFLPLANYFSEKGQYVHYSSGDIKTSTSLQKNGSILPVIKKELEGCTYTQAGIAQGANLLLTAANTEKRIPVIIMLSDGAPSVGTSYYNDVLKYNRRYSTDLGQCQTAGDYESSFGTIKSAMYYKTAIKNKYNNSSTFFYTIGFSLSAGSFEEVVLNPTIEKFESLKNKRGTSYSLYNKWLRDGGKDYSYADGSFIGKMDASTLKNLFLQISNEVIEATKVTQMCVTIEELYNEGYLAKKDIKLSDGSASEYVLINMNDATNQFVYSLARTDEQKKACKDILES